MVSIDPATAARERLTAARAELEEAERAFLDIRLSPNDYRLAEAIHTATCHHNHTDQCGWHYEYNDGQPDWSGWAHARALDRAIKILAVTDVDTAIAVIDALHP